MRGCVLAMLALIQPGCASRDLWPVEHVDPDTAVHVTVMAESWIYALDDPMSAANARDFLNLAVVETNRSGTRAYWLCVMSWSTVDRARFNVAPMSRPAAKVRLGWSTNQQELAPAAGGRSAAGINAPACSVPAEEYGEAWYPLSPADVVRLGAGPPSVVSLIDEAGQPESYVPWRVNAEVMAAFLKATGVDSH